MIQVCEQRGDVEGIRLFRYWLRLLQKLKSGGMSEDEDGFDTVITADGQLQEHVKFTKNLPFRRVLITESLSLINKIPGFEKVSFSQSGRASIRRIRGNPKCGVSARTAPIGWPTSFFPDGYLDSLPDFERGKLRVSQKEFPLFEIPEDFSQYL